MFNLFLCLLSRQKQSNTETVRNQNRVSTNGVGQFYTVQEREFQCSFEKLALNILARIQSHKQEDTLAEDSSDTQRHLVMRSASRCL